MSVIERAEQRFNEEYKAGNDQNAIYWAAYMDGARAQLEEDLKAVYNHKEAKKNGQKAD